MGVIVWTLVVSLLLAFLLGLLLGVFKKIFHVDVDKTVADVRAVLPGANCGGCGFPGCDGLAAAIATGDAPVTACTAGGPSVAEAVGKIMGVNAEVDSKVSVLLCRGSKEKTEDKAFYVGIKSCRAAKLSVYGTKRCDYGCIGFGDCEAACPFAAIAVSPSTGLPEVDFDKCTGCGVCVSVCPQNILSLFSKSAAGAVLRCSCYNQKKPQLLKDCKAACIKCGKCAHQCHTHAISMPKGLPVVDYTLCDSCGECAKGCPTGALALLEKTLCPSESAPKEAPAAAHAG